ncbi:sporulation protein YjcZ [Pullulanibacillus sp. KACC 23026]|uniref:sporulation protein YjcZ n=1 Tax=Pullulanibacillus sp. KACC 23026 TaxID=3028315 RepID=UPI0023B170C6|nr:sporulation protein YjcZ [Pullulanibacillus sp. KACC 23026]WEG12231.1 sporulation protein YjcZ [Pullulanibacillus sp. KACC 23026]
MGAGFAFNIVWFILLIIVGGCTVYLVIIKGNGHSPPLSGLIFCFRGGKKGGPEYYRNLIEREHMNRPVNIRLHDGREHQQARCRD